MSSNPKVFEFAKEVGLTPLALMDKIREWQLPIKSHMAELEPGQLELIKTKLSESKKPSEEKKPAAKKKAAVSTEQAPKKVVAKKAATKEVAKPQTTKTVAATAATKSKAKAAAEAPKASTAVVRRKAKVEEPKEVEETVEEVQEEVHVAPTPVPHVAPVAPPVAAKTEAPQAMVPTPVAQAAAPVVPQEVEKKLPPRKKEVAIGNSGVASGTSAAAPKRNIIGRMDLSRVPDGRQQRPDGGAPRPGGPPRAPIGGGPVRPGGPKGNIRAGFVAQSTAPELPVDDDFGRKRDEKRRNKGGAISEGGPAKVAEGAGQTAHFDAAEFRKREMVFQPKKKKGMLARPAMKTEITKAKASKRVVKVNQTMKLSDLAQAMGVKAPELTKILMKNGVMATMSTDLDFDTIALIAPDFGFEAENVYKTAEEIISESTTSDDADKITRPPVVAVMGHVDHGKTSLLDAIRNADVASGEAGGITQHIGAYQVKLEDGSLITFLDTPGHEAFTAMRARGANATDIAIIVVAADDGVMPQTAEAINHAKAAKVPMIVAVNKIDKPGANPERIKQQLTEYEVVPEEWGGTTIFANVSALKKTGIKELLEQIKLLAEVAELKANPKRPGTGVVIESRLEKGRGPVATILVQDGTVKIGQFIVAGTVVGKVKSLMNYKGERVDEAGPGMPVEVLGLDSVPAASDKFDIVKDERTAEEVAQVRMNLSKAAVTPNSKMSLEDIFSKVQKGDVKDLPIVLKTDVAGSEEAIKGMFSKLSTAEVKVKIIHSAIGGITESDVLLASSAKGIVVGFNVRPDGGATTAAKRSGVEIRTYSIVYELIDDMRKAMAGMLTPDIVEKVLGHAEVRNTFNVPKLGTIAGCSVTDGKIQRSNMARLIRDGKIIYQGNIASLKRFKDDAKEVAQGFECGIGIENFNDVKVGDVIEAYIKEEVARELSAPLAPA